MPSILGLWQTLRQGWSCLTYRHPYQPPCRIKSDEISRWCFIAAQSRRESAFQRGRWASNGRFQKICFDCPWHGFTMFHEEDSVFQLPSNHSVPKDDLYLCKNNNSADREEPLLNYIVCFWRHSPRIQCLVWMLKNNDANSGCVFTPTNSWVQFTTLCHDFAGIL